MCRYKLLHVVRKHLGAQDAAYECVKRVSPDPVDRLHQPMYCLVSVVHAVHQGLDLA